MKLHWPHHVFWSLLLLMGLSLATTSQAQGPPPGGSTANIPDLVNQFDKDGDGFLNAGERKEARAFWEKESSNRPRRRSRSSSMKPGTPGRKIQPGQVKNFADSKLYDPTVLRTIFLEFENEDWEKEMEVFKPTNVEVPATMTVDGKTYDNVGVSFRGASSYFRIPAGLKRSLNLSIDMADKKQRLYGYKSLNLLNCSGDSTQMSSALYSYISGQRIPTPKVNFVRVVINGESWGLYVSSQQFNKVFAKEHFDTSKGARWKVSGSPRGDGGLRYLGDEHDPYRKRFEIKSKDTEKSWNDLINLCRVLNETPADQLEQALEPILDIEGALWFLAVDIAVVNSDGYWTRASDFSIYQEPNGKFYILPHDMNEAFRFARRRGGGGPPRGGGGARGGRGGPPRGAGGGDKGGPPQGRGGRGGNRGGGPPRGGGAGGFGGGGPTLDPMIGLDSDRMPLRSKLLSIPKFQKRYLENLRTIAEMLKWKNIGPRIEQWRILIEDDVAKDTRKLTTVEAFRASTSSQKPNAATKSLRAFCEQRSAYLLNHEKIKELEKAKE